jgi:iron-regulated transporter 1
LKVIDDDCVIDANGATTSKCSVHDVTTRRRPLRDLANVAHKQLGQIVAPITEYTSSPVFLPSFALSMLYCTVLSMHVPMMAYMFAVGLPAYMVSMLRVLGVGVELSATFFAPRMMNKIGTVRSGLWFINWQLGCLLVGATVFYAAGAGANVGPAGDGNSGRAASQPVRTLAFYLAPAGLIGGTILSRFGLWGFDLCAQFLIQEVSAI